MIHLDANDGVLCAGVGDLGSEAQDRESSHDRVSGASVELLTIWEGQAFADIDTGLRRRRFGRGNREFAADHSQRTMEQKRLLEPAEVASPPATDRCKHR